MKLSEVIKAIEDGSESEYKINDFNITPIDGVIKFNMRNRTSYFEINANWEEVKPPRQWSEKELMLFKLLPDWAKWIKRDKVGTVWVFENNPDSEESNKRGLLSEALFDYISISNKESPIYIGDLKGE